MDLPYKAEYAKSNRASCRDCKSIIQKDTLRLAVMVQSPMFDGKTPNWYHYLCFFNKQRPRTVDDIDHFESLRWEDQEKIKSKIESGASVIVPAKKGKKRDAATAAANKVALKAFVLEYSKSSRAGCRGCEQKIMKEEIRISKKDFETEVGRRYGGQDMWHHLTCFAKLRSELGYYESGDQLPGFKSLSKEDQSEVKKQLPPIKQEDVPEKKPKLGDEVDAVNGVDENQLRSQNKMIFTWHDNLKGLSKSELQLLLSKNKQDIPVGNDSMIDRLSDMLTFGALKRCTECKNGQLVFDKLGYKCQGDLTEWSKCDFVTKEPKRGACVIPSELSEDYPFLKKYKYKKQKRLIKDAKPTTMISIVAKKEEDETDTAPKVERKLPPLYNMDFVIIGKCLKNKELKKRIVLMGGKVITKISSTVMAVIGTGDDVQKMISRASEAEVADVQVISEDFLDEAENYSGRIPELVIKKSVCSWGADPHTRLPPEPSTSKSSKSKSKSMFEKSGPSKITMKLKDGGAVDPDSGLENQAHILQIGKDKYTAVLGLTDIQSKVNKFYKLQLLEADNGLHYWLFRAWGRIGTSIGDHRVKQLGKMEAIREFLKIYKEHTGNDWENRHNFVKVPRCYYPVDVDYGEDTEEKLNIKDDIPSKLDIPIQNIVKFIFDVDIMKKVMLEFELDTEKMPLGKLSKKQLQSAYGVLSELQQLVESGATMSRFIDASNRFYTFVPHSFGTDNPTIINDIDTIKKKIEMVDNLMEMEIAYSLMKTSSGGGQSSVDAHYEQLKTEIEVLDRSSEEFSIIEEYITNTHAATHSNYKLDIEEIFVVKRQGEEKRFKPFRKLHNRKLLWHGSRRTNFAGILSQGLRIAPPEAPATGYMFGKGIYFADMVSKSANYCCTSLSNNLGLMLLCEVALGEMDELYNAKYVEKLPKGKHSVKGVGRTEPDPNSYKTLNGDVHVPVGKGKNIPRSSSTSLLYNEYIVYDVAQVSMKYLLKLNFNYNY